jgi:hypothetical protein
MEAKELRIGNYLFYNGDIKEVSSLHDDNTLRFKDGNSSIGCFSTKLLLIKPIPLTEEWLLKFGLNETQFGMTVLSNNLWGILIEKSDVNDSWNVSARDEYIISVIDYVHQLQNLYFALTNQELEIKS